MAPNRSPLLALAAGSAWDSFLAEHDWPAQLTAALDKRQQSMLAGWSRLCILPQPTWQLAAVTDHGLHSFAAGRGRDGPHAAPVLPGLAAQFDSSPGPAAAPLARQGGQGCGFCHPDSGSQQGGAPGAALP